MGKYALLPDSRVVPMSDFFTPSLAPTQVMQDILREQPGLSDSQVAARIGVHESTVSRGTMGKYALLPDSRVVPMSDFFTPSLAPKQVMQDILREQPGLSDSQVAAVLAGRHGIHLARRTVTQYRLALRIAPVYRR
jgi:RNA polymerase sigma-54 factor